MNMFLFCFLVIVCEGEILTGICGEDETQCHNTFDDSTGILIVSGNGKMTEFPSDESRPWKGYLSEIKEVRIEEGILSIGYGAFAKCDNLMKLTIPSSVVSICNSAFSGCSLLSDVQIKNGLKTIGKNTFNECVSLKTITIPDSVETMGNTTFYECSSLETVVIGKGLKSFGIRVFEYCYALTTFIVDEENPYLSVDSFGVLCNKEKTSIFKFPPNSTITEYIIPSTV